MWKAFSGIVISFVWLCALLAMIVGAYGLVRTFFYPPPDISAIQQAAGGVLAVGEAVIAYVIAKSVETILTASNK